MNERIARVDERHLALGFRVCDHESLVCRCRPRCREWIGPSVCVAWEQVPAEQVSVHGIVHDRLTLAVQPGTSLDKRHVELIGTNKMIGKFGSEESASRARAVVVPGRIDRLVMIRRHAYVDSVRWIRTVRMLPCCAQRRALRY